MAVVMKGDALDNASDSQSLAEDTAAEMYSRDRFTPAWAYGSCGLMGPGVASECVESKDGLVVWENRLLRERLGGRRIRFTNDERRRLARRAQALGRTADPVDRRNRLTALVPMPVEIGEEQRGRYTAIAS